jgi:hypothetical protein
VIRADALWATAVGFASVVSMIAPSAAVGTQSSRPAPIAVLSSQLGLEEHEVRDLQAGQIVVKTLDAQAPSHIVVLSAARIEVTPQQFIERLRDSARLWRGRGVPLAGTLGTPVNPSDLAQMRLPSDDIRALRRCRPGNCAVKLSEQQIERVRTAIDRHPDDWHEAAMREFRSTVLDLVTLYRRQGLRGLPTLHDHEHAIDRQAEFETLLAGAPAARQLAGSLVAYLERYPELPLPADAEEHSYWIEIVAPPKPTVQLWHTTIQRRPAAPVADAVVLSRQVLATHYVNGSLALTLLTRAAPERYLVYINWTAVDGLDGFFSGVRRYFVERRVRSAAREAFAVLKKRIERRD